jgi:hypothetical protein
MVGCSVSGSRLAFPLLSRSSFALVIISDSERFEANDGVECVQAIVIVVMRFDLESKSDAAVSALCRENSVDAV